MTDYFGYPLYFASNLGGFPYGYCWSCSINVLTNYTGGQTLTGSFYPSTNNPSQSISGNFSNNNPSSIEGNSSNNTYQSMSGNSSNITSSSKSKLENL